jgi:mRNA interferase HigB
LTAIWDQIKARAMRVIAKRSLRAFWERYPDAEEPLLAWYREVEKEDWSQPAEVKEKYGNASILKENRVVFNIKGNDYRLVVKINYPYRVIYVRFVGTHAQYDAVDVEEV